MEVSKTGLCAFAVIVAAGCTKNDAGSNDAAAAAPGAAEASAGNVTDPSGATGATAANGGTTAHGHGGLPGAKGVVAGADAGAGGAAAAASGAAAASAAAPSGPPGAGTVNQQAFNAAVATADQQALGCKGTVPMIEPKVGEPIKLDIGFLPSGGKPSNVSMHWVDGSGMSRFGTAARGVGICIQSKYAAITVPAWTPKPAPPGHTSTPGVDNGTAGIEGVDFATVHHSLVWK